MKTPRQSVMNRLVHYKEDVMSKKILKRKGEVYHCTQKNGRVKIDVEKTAKGQRIAVGIYIPDTGTWQTNGVVPDIIKKGVEQSFGKPDTP